MKSASKLYGFAIGPRGDQQRRSYQDKSRGHSIADRKKRDSFVECLAVDQKSLEVGEIPAKGLVLANCNSVF
jgi:hypothetical protein